MLVNSVTGHGKGLCLNEAVSREVASVLDEEGLTMFLKLVVNAVDVVAMSKMTGK